MVITLFIKMLFNFSGTLTREKDLSVSPNGGSLFRFDLGNKVSTHIENVSISNGLAWSKDNKRFFYTDSQTKKIFVYNFNEEEGCLGELFNIFHFMIWFQLFYTYISLQEITRFYSMLRNIQS